MGSSLSKIVTAAGVSNTVNFLGKVNSINTLQGDISIQDYHGNAYTVAPNSIIKEPAAYAYAPTFVLKTMAEGITAGQITGNLQPSTTASEIHSYFEETFTVSPSGTIILFANLNLNYAQLGKDLFIYYMLDNSGTWITLTANDGQGGGGQLNGDFNLMNNVLPVTGITPGSHSIKWGWMTTSGNTTLLSASGWGAAPQGTSFGVLTL